MATSNGIYDDPELGQLFFGTYLRNMAASFYDDDYQPYSSVTDKLAYRSVADGLPRIDKSAAPEVSEWLLSKDIVEYAPYKESSTATVFAARTSKGRNSVIRVPISSFGEYAKDDHERIAHPAVLHPFPGCILPYKSSAIEILPFVKVVETLQGDSLTELNESMRPGLPILHRMYGIAGLYSRGIKNDLGVLPDGTPVAVDPDILKFARKALSLQENIRRQDEILRVFPYMKSAAWIKDGKPAQDRFFGSDYLTKPLLSASDVLSIGSRPLIPFLDSPKK